MGRAVHVSGNEDQGPRFDVYVRKPVNVDAGLVRQQALLRGLMPADKLDRLLHALDVQARVQVGSSVTQDWADRVRASFVAVGLEVNVTRILSLEPVVAGAKDLREECPACGELVLVSPSRQCPACQVFVDKVPEEQRFKRRQLQRNPPKSPPTQVPSQLVAPASEFEVALRKRIREEIEAELAQQMALAQAGQRRTRAWVTGVVGVFVLGGFGVGYWSGSLTTRDVLAAQAATSPSAGADAFLPPQGLIGQAAVPGPVAESADAKSQPQPSFSMVLAAQDSLVSSLEFNKKQGDALSIEQAIALAQQPSAGDEIAARVGFGAGSVARQGLGLQTRGAGHVVLPVQQKIEMQAQFVRLLADNGQFQQSAELLKMLSGLPVYASDAQATRLLGQLKWEQQAWEVVHAPAEERFRLIQALGVQLTGIADVAQRTQALRSAAVILAHAPGSMSYASKFFALADTAMNSLTDAAQKQQAQQTKLLATGRIAVLQVNDKAKSGLWVQAQSLAGQFAALLPSDLQMLDVQLAALDWQCKMDAGLRAEAAARLNQVLDHMDREGDVQQRALQLGQWAQGRKVWADERFQRSVAQLGRDLAQKDNLVQARVWAQMALMVADAGLMDQFAAYSKQALAVPLKPEERAQIQADLLVYGEIATVYRLSRAQSYFEAKPHIKTVAQYLF